MGVSVVCVVNGCDVWTQYEVLCLVAVGCFYWYLSVSQYLIPLRMCSEGCVVASFSAKGLLTLRLATTMSWASSSSV